MLFRLYRHKIGPKKDHSGSKKLLSPILCQVYDQGNPPAKAVSTDLIIDEARGLL